ncbi:hypothetical protein KO561_17165 [Radiobacillus kanasensis]|uniref:hypothetical protein n=1 Tax=Radiobacillus kanasensis TaxID=2844358 RepID=UPI001E5DE271|nr:hypothetical protein [Radiobacillus kanasensis]UFT98902.1 hypothetical protein KO561_17165 [Radiobacillus kanasensis]
MKSRTSVILLIFISLFVLGACQSGKGEDVQHNAEVNTEQEPNYLYESETVKVTETLGWQHQNPTNKGEENILFQNGNVKAILTSVSNEKPLEEIKSELKASFANSETMEESETYLSLKSNHQEVIRTDIYLNSGEEKTDILIFMTPSGEYENNQEIIEEFKQNVHYF